MNGEAGFIRVFQNRTRTMRFNKTREILELARALASSAEGLTLDEMGRVTGERRRTVERMRDTIREVFPQLEEIPDHPTKRFRIPRGLDGFFQEPTVEELSDLGIVVGQLREQGATARAEALAEHLLLPADAEAEERPGRRGRRRTPGRHRGQLPRRLAHAVRGR